MKKHLGLLPMPIRELIQKEIDQKVTAERALELWLIFRQYVKPPEEKDDK
jgi:hypothetical protein